MPTVQQAQAQYRRYSKLYVKGLKDEDGMALHGQVTPLDQATPSDVGFLLELAEGMSPDQYRLTLVHECVHIKLFERGLKSWRSHKSQAWKREVQRLADAGFLLSVL
jgi:hypothetical protein